MDKSKLSFTMSTSERAQFCNLPTKKLAEFYIQVYLNYSSKAGIASQSEPEILIPKAGEEKAVISWVHKDTNTIMVSETTFEAGINLDDMVEEAANMA